MSDSADRENSKESPKKGDTPHASGSGEVVCSEEHFGTYNELRILERAVRRRWPVSDEVKEKTVKACESLIDSCQDPKVIVLAARVLVLMEGQNARDEYVAIAADSRRGNRPALPPPPATAPESRVINQTFVNVIGQLSDDQLNALDSVFGALAGGSLQSQAGDPGRKEETPPRTP